MKIKLKNGYYKEIYYYCDVEETKISSECYYNSEDEWHRTDGPAYIRYNRSGELECEVYFINGKDYLKEEFCKIKNINRNLKLLNKK